MNVQDFRIVFMGTPEFAVASLQILVENGCNIVGVITAPDKPAGRGMKLTESAVKKYAVEKGLFILQPDRLKSPHFLEDLKSLHADIQVVVAFRMLPEVVWNMPPMGTVNVHGSLLPAYRGAAPINWAIINGEPETGVTTFKLKQEIDTGDILLQEKIPIGDDETAGELHDKMMVTGARLLLKTLEGLAAKTLTEIPQTSIAEDGTPPPHAPKIFTETARIDWEKRVDEIYNLIRGLSPYPAAFTKLDNKTLKIYKAKKEYGEHHLELGSYQTDGKSVLKFACGDGFIQVEDMQLEGKKRMPVADFLRGFRK